MRAGSFFNELLPSASIMPCSIPIHRAGPTVLDETILSDQTSADSTIDISTISSRLL